ncbi:alanine--tRNA ligase [Dolosicoccus paucivorans]|uniref:alanine--tRNA ligase n=1 Tax=Dolosicoccus paucivorans TaxID=84521 RepID=UPI000C80C5D3|nr:alanine--tRNA ligase [Dolosicoccus paucivorans]PMB84585.1 alanine--tRNA ligase [Dolosicoccus paucivorans]
MKQLTSSQTRQMFLDFFKQKQHEIIPSASLVPVNDPTLLWINSGVAALKKYFDGTQTPDNPRLANSQKSIRTNDIENVGHTARHHTLFEMLGNFSIGEYFKEEAIAWAWEFLTHEDWLDFEPEKLWVTYYPEDKETVEIWKKQPHFISDHLIPIEDNFWDIGAGPCGPNSEIFYDRGPEYNDLPEDHPESYAGGENERWLEIWNLVFSQFNHLPDDTYDPLPHKNIDTGMGLERLMSVIQDTPTNFETDLFLPIIRRIEELSHKKYGEDAQLDISFKVIADHARAVTFAISDGALPSNEGRGYIIRRLIRRSVMHARRLGINGTFLKELVPVIVNIMADFYPELETKASFVQDVLTHEEERFHETIEGGEQQLQRVMDELKANQQTMISGSQAFQLYDTFGFPMELTMELAQESGFTVDEEGFHKAMEEQRQRARAARSDESSMAVQSDLLTSIDAPFEFVGYDQMEAEGVVEAIVYEDESVKELPVHQQGWLFFDQSPFYAEMGGQVADKGFIYSNNEVIGKVIDVQKAPRGQYMHLVESAEQPLNVGQTYTLAVNSSKRRDINKNHTATHLLHRALQKILGEHTHQAGSYVGPDRLRFDFSHFGKVTPEQLEEIEDYVNDWIRRGVNVQITQMPLEEAKALGATALFGEKYGDEVRVVDIAGESIELCGGTHVANTSDIGTFKLMSEAGIGAGIRRIEALTGQGAIEDYQQKEALLKDVQHQLKVAELDQVVNRIQQLQEELKATESQLESLNAQLMQQESQAIFNQVEEIEGVTYIAAHIPNQSMDSLRQLGDMWRQKGTSNVLVVATDNEDRANLMVLVDDETIKKGLKAGDLIKPLAQMIGGGGGGRPQMAQAGGKAPEKIAEMLQAVPSTVEMLLKH